MDTYRLVHDAESNLGATLVFGSNLRPQASKVLIGRATLADYVAVPAGVVVQVNDTHLSTSIQAALNLCVKGRPVVCVEGAADAVHKVLPAHGNAEGVQAVVVDEMLHLVETVLGRVDDAASAASTVRSTAEIQTSNL